MPLPVFHITILSCLNFNYVILNWFFTVDKFNRDFAFIRRQTISWFITFHCTFTSSFYKFSHFIMLACDKIFARLTLKCFNLCNNTLTKFVESVSNRYLNQRQAANKCSSLIVKNFLHTQPKVLFFILIISKGNINFKTLSKLLLVDFFS